MSKWRLGIYGNNLILLALVIATVLTYVSDLSELTQVSVVGDHDAIHHNADHDNVVDSEHVHDDQSHESTENVVLAHPHTIALTPVFGDIFGQEREDIVGVLFSIIPFDKYMTNLLPEGVDAVKVVLWNTCNQCFTFHINGPDVSISNFY